MTYDKKLKMTVKQIQITVAGVNKSHAMPYLLKTYGDDIFEAFSEDLHIPEGQCGKLTHTYIDEERTGTVCDYLGQPYEYSEPSAVHLEKTSYSMTISNEFSMFFEYLQNNAKE